MERWLVQLLNSIGDLTYIRDTAFMALIIVQILKNLIPWVRANKTNTILTVLATQTVLWIPFAIAQFQGYDLAGNDLFQVVRNIIEGLAPLVGGPIAATALAHGGYKALTKYNVPGFRNPTA